MEKVLSFSFPQLSVEDEVILRRAIRAQRAQVLNNTLEKAKSPELYERLGERRVQAVHTFLAEMILLSNQNPDLFWQITDHWATSFLLSRLYDQYGPTDPVQLNKLVSNLNGLLLFERLLNGTLESPATYITYVDANGRIHGLLHDTSLEFKDEAFNGKEVEWVCSASEASVRFADKDEPEFTIPLPLKANQFVEFYPLASSDMTGFPVLEETVVWGRPKTLLEGTYENSDNTEEGWNPLSLKDSLAKAQTVIKNVWPEAYGWLETLIPAFVDMGVPPSRSMRFSSSYDPGSPIFMSRVDNHLAHAEDVLHEIQHHRLLLFADTPHFKSWRDQRQIYASPYRQDPRPLRGLIIGIHAFLTVNELKKRVLEKQAGAEFLHREMTETHYMNLFAFRTILEHEEFGDYGKQLFVQMGRALADHHTVIKSFATSEMGRVAEEKLLGHIAVVEQQSSEIQNTTPIYRNWDETARLAATLN
ncbi:MAG TPA: HEXXH motif-containing putative peptide modification protein [Pyrinomonadaceae bacterium]|nr:HEXXH motif-containing putative peptide modification protein [Pyrinomonadaceae bacterium]